MIKNAAIQPYLEKSKSKLGLQIFVYQQAGVDKNSSLMLRLINKRACNYYKQVKKMSVEKINK